MRVLLLGPYPPPHGGIQTHLVALQQFLRRRGISCVVINLTRFRRPDNDSVRYPRSAIALLGLLLRLRYDIVHLHLGGNVTTRLFALGLLCCCLRGKRAVLTLHSGGYASSTAGKTAHARTWRGFVFRRFGRLIAVNRQIGELFERFGVPPARIRCIPPHSLPPPPADGPLPAPLREFFKSHQPVLLTVGLLEPEYDLPLQVDVLGPTLGRFPRAGLIIIGSGSRAESLERLIRAKPYAKHVLLCGDVPHRATLRAMAECDVFLRTTLFDGDSIAVREALHLGVPVIATDNGMRPPGVALIPPADVPALQNAIDRAIAGAWRQPRARCSEEENLDAVCELYRELMIQR